MFVELPDEVNQIILNYLPEKDLLNASLVCRNWMKYIGKSLSFRKGIVINASSFSEVPKISLDRSYESLNLRQFKMNDKMFRLIKSYEWRTVNFNVQKIPSQKEFVSIMKNLEHLKELKILNLSIRKLTDHKKLLLPHLECLLFSDVAVDTFEIFMCNQPSLKSLSLRFLSCDIANTKNLEEYILEFLILNIQIRELELYADVVNNLFKVDVSKVLSLNLKFISFNFYDINNPAIRTNIENFLKSQENSLEELKIQFQQKIERVLRIGRFEEFYVDGPTAECEDIWILMNVWNNLSNLKKLTLRFITNFAESLVAPSTLMKFKANPMIQSLYIKHIGCEIPKKLLQAVMMLCPNMRHLYISNLDENVIKFCAENFKMLRLVSYSIEINDSLNVYTAMINANDNNVNKFIKIQKDYQG